MKLRKSNIRPTTSVYRTYKSLSYKPWTAIAEFVDNSSASFFKNEDLFDAMPIEEKKIEIIYDKIGSEGHRLIVKDTAMGMDFEEFERAIKIDKPPKDRTGRNEFGMGLKTAACWYSDKWTISSTKYGSDKKYTAVIDVKHLVEDTPDDIDIMEEDADPMAHGTSLIMEDLNNLIRTSKQTFRIQEMLASIYRRDLQQNKYSIKCFIKEFSNTKPYKDFNNIIFDSIQDIPCIKFDQPETYTKEGIETVKEWNASIPWHGENYAYKAKIGIMKKGNRRNAGLVLMRRGRVILGGPDMGYFPHEIFGEKNSFQSLRIFGEIDMDTWPVTQQKDDFAWNDGLEFEFIDDVKKHLKELIKTSQTIRVREDTETHETKIDESAEELLRTNGLEIHEMGSEMVYTSETTQKENNFITLKNDKNNTSDELSKPIKVIPSVELSSKDKWITLDETEEQIIVKINMQKEFFKPFLSKKEFNSMFIPFCVFLIKAEIDAMDNYPLVKPSYIREELNKYLK